MPDATSEEGSLSDYIKSKETAPQGTRVSHITGRAEHKLFLNSIKIILTFPIAYAAYFITEVRTSLPNDNRNLMMANVMTITAQCPDITSWAFFCYGNLHKALEKDWQAELVFN